MVEQSHLRPLSLHDFERIFISRTVFDARVIAILD